MYTSSSSVPDCVGVEPSSPLGPTRCDPRSIGNALLTPLAAAVLAVRLLRVALCVAARLPLVAVVTPTVAAAVLGTALYILLLLQLVLFVLLLLL